MTRDIIKVLIATNPKMDNPYTRTLTERISEISADIDITIDIDAFWQEGADKYDVIHIMFPHELLNGQKHTSSEIRSRLAELRAKGLKIISTCHNFEPHYAKGHDSTEAYKVTYANSDMILHLAEYSKSIFDNLYQQADNVLLYHHTYDNIYSNAITRDEARVKLGLPSETKYVLSFGILRDDEERDMLTNLAVDLPADIKLWVPSYYRVNKSRNPVKYGYRLARYLVTKMLNSKIRMQHQYVSHDDLPLYFAAADAVVIPRIKILNSGNLPMAFYFGKPVAGPSVGNVGQIIAATGNYAFDPTDRHNIAETVKKAVQHPETGDKNKKIAQEQMSSRMIATQLVNYYRTLTRQ